MRSKSYAGAIGAFAGRLTMVAIIIGLIATWRVADSIVVLGERAKSATTESARNQAQKEYSEVLQKIYQSQRQASESESGFWISRWILKTSDVFIADQVIAPSTSSLSMMRELLLTSNFWILRSLIGLYLFMYLVASLHAMRPKEEIR